MEYRVTIEKKNNKKKTCGLCYVGFYEWLDISAYAIWKTYWGFEPGPLHVVYHDRY